MLLSWENRSKRPQTTCPRRKRPAPKQKPQGQRGTSSRGCRQCELPRVSILPEAADSGAPSRPGGCPKGCPCPVGSRPGCHLTIALPPPPSPGSPSCSVPSSLARPSLPLLHHCCCEHSTPGLTAIKRLGRRHALPARGPESLLFQLPCPWANALREKRVRKHGRACPQLKRGVWKRVIFVCAFASENSLSHRGLS